MGIFALGDILKAKVDKLLGNITGFKTYISVILVILKETLYNHI